MEDTLYFQLRKLSAVNSEETLDQVLTTLWKTRRTGLRSLEKSNIQSLLSLSSAAEVDLVLACLRSLIRKCVSENCIGDDLLKLFPPDLPLDLQNILVLLLQKYQCRQWKEEELMEQQQLPTSSVSCQVKPSAPPSFTPLLSYDVSTFRQPCQEEPLARKDSNIFENSALVIDDATESHLAPISMQPDPDPPNNSEKIPRLKSMTWTIQNVNSAPASKVAIVHLKLEDYSKSPVAEREMKFLLTKDTIEATLRSLTYISEKFSSSVSLLLHSSEYSTVLQRVACISDGHFGRFFFFL